MIGYHSVPVIADAYFKGVRGLIRPGPRGDENLRRLNRLGWSRTEVRLRPGDLEGESVSKTLEYAYDDWCISRFAGALGDATAREIR